MAAIENRYEILVLVNAENCNPNGDPNMNNMPRVDWTTGKGIITDVSIKARQRAYVASAFDGKSGYQILVRNGESLNKRIAEAVFEANGVSSFSKDEKNTKVDASAAIMCERYWDVRTFGGVLSTGLNAGQVRGAVQIGMASSVDDVEACNMSITRMCFTEGKYPTLDEYDDAAAKMDDDKKRTFGDKNYIPYGLYVVKMTVSANLAQKVGFSEDDLKVLLESTMQMYDASASSSKMGMSVLSPIIVFKHVGTQADTNSEQGARERLLGCAPAYKLFDLLTIKRKDGVAAPRKYQDYNMNLHLSKLPAGVVCGIKKLPFSDVEWLSPMGDVDLMTL